MNVAKCFGLLYLLTFNLNAQVCLTDGVTFTYQEEIDNFKVDYPGCQIIGGDVYINDTNISNLDSLNNIKSIKGKLILIDNPPISLLGLGNVVSLGGLSIIDDGLNDFEGLDKLELIYGDFIINDCYGTGTEGLLALKEVQGDFNIYDNSALSLTGFPLLETIGGNLMIEENDISGIEGLMSVKSIGGQLIIRDNSSLESLTGLDSIDAGTITKLILDTSSSLSFCSVKSICDYLSLGLGPSEIGENLTGCNTEDEILDLCSSSTGVLDAKTVGISIYPNPVSDLLEISHELSDVSELAIFDSRGNKLLECLHNVNQLNVSHLPKGMYVLALRSGANMYHYTFSKID